MEKEYELDDVIHFGDFTGMTVREAADKRPRYLFKMQNGTVFNLSKEALTYVEEKMR